MTHLNSMASLGLSIGALVFVAWMALAHPVHESVFGPPAAAAGLAASSV